MALKKAKKMLSILLAGCMTLTPASGMAQAEMLDYETVQEDASYDDAYAVGTADLEYPDEVFETGATLDEGAGELLDDEELLAEAEPEFQEETAESDLFADIPGETEGLIEDDELSIDDTEVLNPDEGGELNPSESNLDEENPAESNLDETVPSEEPEDLLDEADPDAEADLEVAGEQEGEYWVERRFNFGDRSLLRGWTDHVDHWHDCYVEGGEYREGQDFRIEVTDVRVEDENVVRIDYMDDNGWELRARNHGETRVIVTYTDWDGTEGKTTDYMLYVGNDVYDMWFGPDTGSYNIMPGRSVNLSSHMTHQIEDPETGQQRHLSDEEMGGVTYSWQITEGGIPEEWIGIINIEGDGFENSAAWATLTVGNPPERWTPDQDFGFGIDLIAYEDDEEGTPQEVCRITRWFWLRPYYAEIWIQETDSTEMDWLKVGEERRITPELRFYGYDNENDYEVGEITSYTWFYDGENLDILDEDGTKVGYFQEDREALVHTEACEGNGRSFTIRRRAAHDVGFHLEVEFDDGNAQTGTDFWMGGIDYWFDFDEGRVHSDGEAVFDLHFNDNYQELNNFEVRAEVGIWENDDFVETFEEGDGWWFDQQATESKIHLNGDVLYNEKHLEWVEVRLTAYAILPDEEEAVLFQTQHGFDVNEAGIWDVPIGDENLFPGDERDIAKDDGSSLRIHDTAFANQGEWQRFRVLSLELQSEEDPYDDRPAAEIIEEDDYRWKIRAIRSGEVDVNMELEVYNDETGTTETWEYTAKYWVGNFRAHVDLISENGSWEMKNGGSLTLRADMDAEEQDGENGWRHQADMKRFSVEFEPRVNWIDDEWFREQEGDVNWDEAAEPGRFWNYEVNDDKITITANDDCPNMDIYVEVTMFDSNEDGDRWECRRNGRNVSIKSYLYGIALQDEWNTKLPPGGEAPLNPTLMVYDDEHPDGIPYDGSEGELIWRFEWYEGDGNEFGDNIPHVVITDTNGTRLSQQDNGNTGDAPFTVKRICDWRADPRIIAYIKDRDGNENEAARLDLNLDRCDYETGFKSSSNRGDNWRTWFYDGETARVEPIMDSFNDLIDQGYPIEISLEYGYDYDEDGNLRPIKTFDIDEEGHRGDETGEFSFTNAEFSENGLNLTRKARIEDLREQLRYQHDDWGNGNSEMVIKSTVTCNGIRISEDDIWVGFYESYRRMEDDDYTILTGFDFHYEDRRATLYVEDAAHWEGNDQDDRPGTYYDVTILNIETSDPRVLYPEYDEDSDTWRIHANRPGDADITYTFINGPNGEEEDEHVTTLHVSDDWYFVQFEDENGEEKDYYDVLLNDDLTLRPVVYHEYNDPRSEEGRSVEEVDQSRCNIWYDWDGWMLENHDNSGVFTALRRGDTDVNIQVDIFEGVPDESDHIFHCDTHANIHIDTVYGKLYADKDTVIFAGPGESFTAQEIAEKIGLYMMVYSMKNPDGEQVDYDNCWFGYVGPFEIDDDHGEITIPEDILETEEVDDDGICWINIGGMGAYSDGVWANQDAWILFNIHEHQLTNWQTTTPATVFAQGVQTRHCTVEGCDHTEEKKIAKLSPKLDLTQSVTLDVTRSTTVTATMAKGDTITAASTDKSGTATATFTKTADKATLTIKAGKTAGNAKITVRTKAGASKVINVKVNPATLSLSKKALSMEKSKTATVTATMKSFDKVVKATTTDSKIATATYTTVTGKSTLTIKSGTTTGTATITVTTDCGATDKITVTVLGLKQPTLIAAYNGAKGIGVKFIKEPEAKKYLIFQKDQGKWKQIAIVDAKSSSLQASGNTLMYTDTSVAKLYGRGYIYSVAAKNDTTTTGYDTIGVAIYRLNPPTITKVTNSANGTATVTWKGLFGKTETNGNYDLQMAAVVNGKTGEFKSITKLPGYSYSTTSAKVTGLKKGTKYIFRMRCSKTNKDRGTFYSEYSPWMSVTITK